MSKQDKPRCKHCGRPTVRAHLFPLGFSHRVRDGEKNMSLLRKMSSKVRAVQSFGFDDGILCAGCDGKIGSLDKYALKFCHKARGIKPILYPHFMIRNVDTNQLVRFAASIVWRFGISSRPETQEIDLGPEAGAFEHVIFNEAQSPIAYPELALMRYQSKSFADVEHFSMGPTLTEAMGAHFYCFALGGFRFSVKMDRGNWPKNLRPGPINGHEYAAGIFVNLDTSSEFETMHGILARMRASRHTV